MAIVIKCPNCDKKLKLAKATPGKRVRCPGCQEPFAPVPLKGGKKGPAAKKKRPAKKAAPMDDFGDDAYGDDGMDDPQPQPRRRSSAGKGRKAKPAPSKKSSKLPLIIGGVVLLLLGGGAAAYFLLAGGGDEDPIVQNDGAAGDDAPDASGGRGAPSTNMGGGAAGGAPTAPGAPAMLPGMPPGSPPGAASTATASASGPASPTPSPVSLAYLPADTEAVAYLKVNELANGPAGPMIQNLGEPIQQFEAMTGLTIFDLESLTIGVAGIDAAVQADKQPDPSELPLVVVIRTSKAIDMSRMQLPNATQGTLEGNSFLKVPMMLPVGIWAADSNTLVMTAEQDLAAIMKDNSGPKAMDGQMLDGTSTLQIAFTPKNAARLLAGFNVDKMTESLPPQARNEQTMQGIEFLKILKDNAKAIGVGVTFTDDVGYSMAIRTPDATTAQQIKAGMDKQNEASLSQVDASLAQVPGPMQGMVRQLIENAKVEADGSLVKNSSIATGGGQQVAAMVGMAMMMASMGGNSGGGPPAMSMGMGPPGMSGPPGMNMGPAEMNGPPGMGAGDFGGPSPQLSADDQAKNIALALHNFHAAYDRFPRPATDSGLSWRVHLLGYLGHEELYKKFNLEEPWDGPTNKPLIDEMPEIYQSKRYSTVPFGETVFQLPVGPGTLFENNATIGMGQITDGTSNTILLVETSPAASVAWTKPADWNHDPADSSKGLGKGVAGEFTIVTADGRVQQIPTAEASKLGPMLSPNAGN